MIYILWLLEQIKELDWHCFFCLILGNKTDFKINSYTMDCSSSAL